MDILRGILSLFICNEDDLGEGGFSNDLIMKMNFIFNNT
jgi:hypothetical protein